MDGGGVPFMHAFRQRRNEATSGTPIRLSSVQIVAWEFVAPRRFDDEWTGP